MKAESWIEAYVAHWSESRYALANNKRSAPKNWSADFSYPKLGLRLRAFDRIGPRNLGDWLRQAWVPNRR